MGGLERYSQKTLRTFAIGDVGPGGGFIFITPSTSGNNTGKYFEVLPPSAVVQRRWSEVAYESTIVNGADGTAIGTGYQNTLDIVNQGNSSSLLCAAVYCLSLKVNGFSDWFLPSLNELEQIYVNFSTRYPDPFNRGYWSSTEFSSTNSMARYFVLNQTLNAAKSSNKEVIAVRSFTVDYSSSVQRLGNDSVYGSGSDGNVTIATNTSLTRDMYYNNLTINSGVMLNTAGFKVFVKNLLTLNGGIGVGTLSGSTVGEPSAPVSNGSLLGNGTSTSLTYSIGGVGGGGSSSTATQLPETYRTNIEYLIFSSIPDPSTQSLISIKGGSAGTTGTAGANAPIYVPSSWPGIAGATGSNGTYSPNASTVNAPGGRGNTGYPGTKTGATVGPGGAGGTGGRGGAVVLIVAKTITGTGKIISLGMSGTAGSSGTSGSPGTAGAAKTAYASTTQRGTSGVDLVDGHQAPQISHSNPNANAHGAYDTHNHTHIPHHGHGDYAIHHIALVGRNFHSHSYTFDTGFKGMHQHAHAGHTHPGHQYGHNHHYQHADSGHHGENKNQNHYVYGHSHPGHFGHYHVSNNHGSIHGTGPHHNHEPHIGHTNSHTTQNWIHVPASAGTHVAPTTYNGGAGGDGGAAAPAVTGDSGKRGGAGGGGGVIMVTDAALPGTVTIDNRAGLTADSDNFSASSGYSYVIINT